MRDVILTPNQIDFLTAWYEERLRWWHFRLVGALVARQNAFQAIPHSENPPVLEQQVADLDDEVEFCTFALYVFCDELDFVEKHKNKRES